MNFDMSADSFNVFSSDISKGIFIFMGVSVVVAVAVYIYQEYF